MVSPYCKKINIINIINIINDNKNNNSSSNNNNNTDSDVVVTIQSDLIVQPDLLWACVKPLRFVSSCDIYTNLRYLVFCRWLVYIDILTNTGSMNIIIPSSYY